MHLPGRKRLESTEYKGEIEVSLEVGRSKMVKLKIGGYANGPVRIWNDNRVRGMSERRLRRKPISSSLHGRIVVHNSSPMEWLVEDQAKAPISLRLVLSTSTSTIDSTMVSYGAVYCRHSAQVTRHLQLNVIYLAVVL